MNNKKIKVIVAVLIICLTIAAVVSAFCFWRSYKNENAGISDKTTQQNEDTNILDGESADNNNEQMIDDEGEQSGYEQIGDEGEQLGYELIVEDERQMNNVLNGDLLSEDLEEEATETLRESSSSKTTSESEQYNGSTSQQGTSISQSSNANATSSSSSSNTSTTGTQISTSIGLTNLLPRSSTFIAKDYTKVATITRPIQGTWPQGGYTDGRYYYQTFVKISSSDEKNNDVYIVKYDLKNNTTVKQSDRLALNHANDVTYNSKLGQLVVCHNTPKYQTVSYINPTTLKLVGTSTAQKSLFSIDYNATRNQYIAGIAGKYSFCILDNTLQKVINVFDMHSRTNEYTKQGVCCDDNYIYFVFDNSDAISVYDWNGKFVTLIELAEMGEPENISVVNNDIYISIANISNGNVSLYKINGLVAK